MRSILLPAAVCLVACSAGGDRLPPGEPRGGPPAGETQRMAPATVSEPEPSLAQQSQPSSAARYDLAADLEAREREAREDLGAKTATATVHDVFLLASPEGKAALHGPRDITERAITALLNGRFAKKPARIISVYLFGDAGRYEKYCRSRSDAPCVSPYGYYSRSERRIVMNVGLGIGTLTHELVHPLMEADFPDAPEWLNEGIASLYEQPILPRKGEIRGGKNWRHPRVLLALAVPAEREIARPSALFVMGDSVFRSRQEDLNYATARYVCQWLDSRNELWPFYQRFRDGYATDPTGSVAFTAVTGLTPSEADAPWVRWVRGL